MKTNRIHEPGTKHLRQVSLDHHFLSIDSMIPGNILRFCDCGYPQNNTDLNCWKSSERPGSSDGKVCACNVGDPGSIPGLGRSPGEGNGNPLQILLPGKFHGCRSLVGYSPGGCKESETTKRLHFHFSFNAFLKYWSSTQ